MYNLTIHTHIHESSAFSYSYFMFKLYKLSFIILLSRSSSRLRGPISFLEQVWGISELSLKCTTTLEIGRLANRGSYPTTVSLF